MFFIISANHGYAGIGNLKIDNKTIQTISIIGDSIQSNKQFDLNQIGKYAQFNSIMNFSETDLKSLIRIINPYSFKYKDSLNEQFGLCRLLADTYLDDSKRFQSLMEIFESKFKIKNKDLAFEKTKKFIQCLLFDSNVSKGYDVKSTITSEFCKSQTSRDVENTIDHFTDDKEFEDLLFFVILNYSTDIYNDIPPFIK